MALDDKRPSVYPTLRYTDADAAIAFLTSAFGLHLGEVSRGADGKVAHAELGWGNGVIMLGSRSNPPDQFDGGLCTLYLAVEDPDAHHERAAAAGAEIIMPLTDQPYGSREYVASDPEGNRWSFGTYQPEVP